MDKYSFVIAFFFIIVGLPVIVGVGGDTLKRWLKHKEKMAEALSAQTAEKAGFEYSLTQIRLNVGAFMHNLFRQGAFQGRTPREAYLVKCDKETTTQNDINLGIVNILVGFAPLKPAEFVIIKIQQLAGQIAA